MARAADRNLRSLQANLNHCRRAQDLLVQHLTEWGVGLAIVSEPWSIPANPAWTGDDTGSVAIWGMPDSGPSPLSLLERGDGFVAVRRGDLAVVGIYASPNAPLASFEQYLVEVERCIVRSPLDRIIVGGDFNAKSHEWGSPRNDARGEVVAQWARRLGLRLLNRGTASTCVRVNGESIVDLTFASPGALPLVRGWRVDTEAETLSDHRYIRWEVSAPAALSRPGDAPPPPGWSLRQLNADALMAAAHTFAWAAPPAFRGADEGAAWLGRVMADVCDAAMPRFRPFAPRPAVYWWSAEIASLRQECILCRRRYTRARRRRAPDAQQRAADLYGDYRDARRSLQVAIKEAKARAWRELLQTLDTDPWGRPYKLVLNKLRTGAPPVAEGLDPQFLGGVLSTLFPSPGEERVRPPLPDHAWSEELGVSEAELQAAVRRLRGKNTAPGPDGVPGRALALASDPLASGLRRVFNDCLRLGQFPERWKRARLVLLRKEGKPADSPSAYRPICLLDEAGKLFERIIAARLTRHLERMGPGLAETQYGFREGRSTVDAVKRLRSLSAQGVSRGGVALAVSLDIANAFNTLPWESIERGLEAHQVPAYLRRQIGSYLRGRTILFRSGGIERERAVEAGVPQGSVLGPLLWNIGYNRALTTVLPDGVTVVCYADDTAVIAVGNTWESALSRAEEGVSRMVEAIRRLGLQVACAKTEAMWFHSPRRRPPAGATIKVGGSAIEVGAGMNYLGLRLDSKWRFTDHFKGLAPRAMGMAGALSRLLPNLGGPRGGVRRLYLGVVQSVLLYGAPVWSAALAADRRSKQLLRQVQTRLMVRAIRGYRTISGAAAGVLAGVPPVEILAGMYAELYSLREAFRRRLRGASPQEAGAIRAQWALAEGRARRSAIGRWRSQLADPLGYGRRVVDAVLPVLEDWLGRRWGEMGYRLTQVVSGHGCFGDYLHRIGREPTPRCHHCPEGLDTAQHTLEHCQAWCELRRVLVAQIGADLSLGAVIKSMIASRENWEAVSSFCERVMLQKEEAERERELASRNSRGANPRGGRPARNSAGRRGGQGGQLARRPPPP